MDCAELDNEMESLTISDEDWKIAMKFDRSKWPDILNLPVTDDPVLLQKFQRERLKQVLKYQEEERNDSSFSRDCLFCRQHFRGNRDRTVLNAVSKIVTQFIAACWSMLFEHLTKDHNFHVGAPDNIVFGNELLDVLSEKLEKLQCFYCEKTFKDWMALKEHMRKKQHKRINPKNKTYDKFYLINYLELGKNWTDVQNEDDFGCDYDEEEMLNEDEMEYQDEVSEYICLFCENKELSLESTFLHMKDYHGFDYEAMKNQHQLDFYKQVKLINYIRRQVDHRTCIICEEQFSCQPDLLQHLNVSGHGRMFPEESKWNQVMFYFPTYENDSLLCALEDASEDSAAIEPVVVPEDIIVNTTSVLTDEETRKQLLSNDMT